jgi:hypothetical protein
MLLAVRNHAICLVPVAGGSPQLVYQPADTVTDALPGGVALWSLDGHSAYFKAADREGRASIWGVPITGGRPRLLVRFDDPAKPSYRQDLWHTDGRRFYFTINERQSDIYVAELEGLK